MNDNLETQLREALHREQPPAGFAERVLLQLIWKSPVNVRPLVGVKPMDSTKGRGYMAWGYLLQYRAANDETCKAKAIACLDWLVANTSSGQAGYSWGNHFDFVTRSGCNPAGSPIIVWTSLIGQAFSSPGYFRSRPSAAGAAGYDADASGGGGSNLGPTNKALISRVESDTETLQKENPGTPVPVDLVTTSASGLDPHISIAAAEFQAPRVAHARGIPEPELQKLIDAHTESRQFGFLGEPRVNVLELNLALDAGDSSPSKSR